MESDSTHSNATNDNGLGDSFSVLIIEGSNADARIVQSQLHNDGRFSVEHAQTLCKGLERLNRGDIPDAIALDLNLPDSAGLETFRIIHELFPNEPIVILAGEHDESKAIQAMRLGAQDYIHKSPLDGAVLVRSVLYSIERNRRRLAQQRQRAVERELDFAKQIQQHLLPSTPPEIGQFDVAGKSASADSTSGDFFDFIDHGDGKWDVVLADVCGHGIGPAMITVGTRRLLRSCAAMHEDLGLLMTIANQGICEDTFQSLFITLFFVRLDPSTMRLNYVGAGHPAFLIGGDGKERDLETRGIPTGVDPNHRYQIDGSIQLAKGEIILLMTDGIWEAGKSDSITFGKQRAFDLVHRFRDRPAGEIATELITAVQDFCHPMSIRDDITAVVIKSR